MFILQTTFTSYGTVFVISETFMFDLHQKKLSEKIALFFMLFGSHTIDEEKYFLLHALLSVRTGIEK